jgi:hypothetical protein
VNEASLTSSIGDPAGHCSIVDQVLFGISDRLHLVEN